MPLATLPRPDDSGQYQFIVTKYLLELRLLMHQSNSKSDLSTNEERIATVLSTRFLAGCSSNFFAHFAIDLVFGIRLHGSCSEYQKYREEWSRYQLVCNRIVISCEKKMIINVPSEGTKKVAFFTLILQFIVIIGIRFCVYLP